MVYYSPQAIDDLYSILWGLANWGKFHLNFEHVEQYVLDIQYDADTICTKPYHQNCFYEQHRQYGEKVHTYSRNSQTQWYIIYDWDPLNRVAFVNKILNNYLTIN